MRATRRVKAAMTTAVVLSLLVPMPPAAADPAPARAAALASATGTAADLSMQVRSVAGTPQGLTRGRFGRTSLTTKDWRGCNGLQRALIAASLTRPRVGARCAMTGGTWRLTGGSIVSGAENVTALPVLTTSQAWAQGAFGWTPAQRQAFATRFPVVRSRALSSGWPASQRNCTITRSGSAAGVGCAYAVVSSDVVGDSLLTALEQEPDSLDCPALTTLVGTLVAWDLSLGAPALSTLRSRALTCSQPVSVARVRTPMDMGAVLERNPYLPGSTMLPSVYDLLTAPAGAVVTRDLYGLHTLPGSGVPDVPYGVLRLWDAGVGWDIVQPRRGEFDWTGLDRIVDGATASGHRVIYTLGRTPWWAASRKTDPPRRMSDLATFITALARRYGDRIYAYEMWNEANLTSYYTGTPAQMAVMTQTVHDVLDRARVASIVIAASTTVRIMATTYRFFPAYLSSLRRLDWPIDAFAVHTYPRPGGGPDEHTAGIVMVKAMLVDADAPDLPLLDTEVNYGLGGLGLPKRDIDPPLAGAYVAQTFLESLRMGISSVEWYGWTPRVYPLLGLQLHPGTTSTNAAWTAVHDLVVGARFVGCTELGVAQICGFERAGQRYALAYSPSGTPGVIDVPAQWQQQCALTGPCAPVIDARTAVGISPTVLTAAAP